MIDWFVLLIPLALLPVFLLFVFVGCHLIGGAGELIIQAPVSFNYDGNLDTKDNPETDIMSFTVEIEYQANIIGSITRANPEFEDPATDPPKIDNNGDHNIPVAHIDPGSEGEIKCTCRITLQSGTELDPITNTITKSENANPPEFTLERHPDPPSEMELFRIV